MHEFAVLIGAKAQKMGKTKKVSFKNQVIFFTSASKQILVAQLVRRQSPSLKVTGSNPAPCCKNF